MKVQTLDSAIETIKADNEKKINAEILRYSASEKTGIPVENIIAYTHTNGLNFGWRNTIDNKDAIKSIVASFPIDGKNYEMRFADSSKNFDTDCPLIVKWTNETREYSGDKNFKLQYKSNDIEITITVPLSHFGNHVYGQLKQGKHLGFGRYQQLRNYNIDYFYTQRYSGGYNTLYFLKGAETLAEYINFVLTGEFKYQSEI
jgi:hypothetical protein